MGNAVEKLNDFHLMFARWRVENPEKTLAQASEEFGYTVSWLSSVANSDAFKAHMAELGASADAMVIGDIPSRLRGLAHASLTKLEEQLGEVLTHGPAARVDRDFTKQTADMALKSLGYGRPVQGKAPEGERPSFSVTIIQEARERILNKGRTIEGEKLALTEPEGAS